MRLSVGIRNAVLIIARREKTTAAAVFLAAYMNVVRNRHVDSIHCVITNVPGRSLPGAANASGAFYNSVPLILPLVDSNFEAISAATNALFDALDHQNVPAPLISMANIRQGGAALPDIAPVSFNVTSNPLCDFELPGCRLWEVDLATLAHPKWGHLGPIQIPARQDATKQFMDCIVSILPASIVVTVEYTTAHADPKDVKAFLTEYEAALREICDGAIDDSVVGRPGLVADWTC
jgi:hypothetical protein